MVPFSRRILQIVALCALLAYGCKSANQSTADQGTTLGGQSDQGWPRTYEKDGQQVIIFQPQVQSWTNQQQLKFRPPSP